MHPEKVARRAVKSLTDLPNVGKATEKDLRLLGIHQPADLVGKNPWELYERLCEQTGKRHDPCVIDVFMSITAFMAGDAPRPWWHFSPERKRLMEQRRAT